MLSLKLKEWLGPLGVKAILVFLSLRSSDIANLLCRLYLGKKLSSDDFGAIDPVYAFLSIFSIPIIGVFQIASKSLSRFITLGKALESRCLLYDMTLIAITGSLLSIGAFICVRSFVLTRLHLTSEYTPIIALLFFIAWLVPFSSAIYQGWQKYQIMVFQCVLSSIAILALSVMFVGKLDYGLLGAMFAKIIPALFPVIAIAVILTPVLSGTKKRDSDEFRLMKEMFVPVNIYLGTIAILTNVIPLFIRNFNLGQSGGYSALATFGIIPSYFIASIVFVIFPVAAAEHAAGNEINRLYKGAVTIGILVTIACVILFYFTAEPIMQLWNVDFVPYAKYLWIYALAMGMNGVIQVVASVKMARHEYSFLWFLVLPSIAMCVLLYFCRTFLDVPIAIATLVIIHALILTCLGISELMNRKKTHALLT